MIRNARGFTSIEQFGSAFASHFFIIAMPDIIFAIICPKGDI